MKATWVALLATGLMTASLPARAQPKPVVQVRLVIEAPAYRSHFDAAEETRIQAEGAAELARQANDRFGFLTFRSVTGPQQLTFIIANTNRFSTSRGSEVSIFVDFTSASGEKRSARWRPFRTAAQAIVPIGSVDQLLGLIRTAGEETSWAPIEQLLTSVPITTQASVEAAPVRWVLQYTGRDLCIQMGSLVQVGVRLRVPGSTDPIESEYTAQIIAWRPSSPAGSGRIVVQPLATNDFMPELAKAAAAGGVTPTAIRVRQYRRDYAMCTPLQRTSPSR